MSNRNDVRMSGFRSRSTVVEALDWVDKASTPVEKTETVPLESATGRVLAADLIASANVPAFDRSAMDGYAVHASETVGASEYNPVSLRIVGQSMPGKPADRSVNRGEAIRIMTGAPIPEGADAVVPAEYATETGQNVDLTTSVATGKHIGRIGEDIRTDQTVLREHRRLRAQDLAVAASLGIAEFEVLIQPKVRIVVTGNELVQPGQDKGPHQIYEANSYLLRSLVPRDGGIVESIRHCQDHRDAIETALTDTGADVALVSGGSSVGQEDIAPGLVHELGELGIHGISMRPSSPTGLGRIEETLVCLLPGNPVSCLCAYDFFGGRMIRRLAGLSEEWPHRTVTAPLTRKAVSAIGRMDYCRVRLTEDGVEPLAISGASILSSTTRADGFMLIEPESEGLPSGELVTVYLYE